MGPTRRISLIFLIFVMGACTKWEDRIVKDENLPENFEEMIVDESFNWETSESVQFVFSNVPAGIVQITTVNENTVFHKGNNQFDFGEYRTKVTLPSYITKVKVNGETISVAGSQVTYDFMGKKRSILSDYSLDFDGSDDYVQIDEDELIDDYPYTLAAWIKTDGFSDPNEDMVILNLADPSKDNRYYGIFIGEDEGGVACLRARKGSHKTINGTTVLTDDQWHFVVGVFNGKKDRKLYVDGVLEASDTRNVIFDDDAEDCVIGRWGDETPKSYFNGNIDDVQVWEEALSQSQIASLYNNPPSGNEEDLVAFWNFDTGWGNTAFDQTSNENDGSIHGAAWANDSGGSNDSDGDGITNDVDDYPNDPNRAFNNYFPASGYGSLAFEDLWPGTGDYDFNDVVVDYQFQTVTNASNFVVEILADFVARASGASQQNGFGFQFPNDNVAGSDLSVSGMSLNVGYINTNANGTEANQSRHTVIVFDNFFEVTPNTVSETGTNTDPNGVYVLPDTVSINMDFAVNTYTANDIDIENFNPFIIVNMFRGTEVHLADFPPTDLADTTRLGTSHDDSDPDLGRYYKTDNNLPWAINLYENFDYPEEKKEITSAYLKFANWAVSAGVNYPDWYQNNAGYRNPSHIY
ncbi:MAG: LruC domain-containing protein [Bacteroidales bacterium]|nr:LruC domain-containing protein [Bacteroidales bacterium]MCF8387598.1 LruC domain-containing protein [Bacteroidales bacterium]MCF8397596.1 LruC domain-containing protein [Bacteroidales bacterium]